MIGSGTMRKVDMKEISVGRSSIAVDRSTSGLMFQNWGLSLFRMPFRSFDAASPVKDEAEAIYTDELASYMGIEDHNTRHETVRHSIKQWVVGDVYTNSVEGVWSLFKRSIVGAFHRVSVKHLDRYLEELEWRFNNRDNPYIFRDAMRQIVHADTLTYRELVDGKDEAAAEGA